MIVFVLVFLFADTDLAPTVQKTEGKVDNGNISEMKHQCTVISGLNQVGQELQWHWKVLDCCQLPTQIFWFLTIIDTVHIMHFWSVHL